MPQETDPNAQPQIMWNVDAMYVDVRKDDTQAFAFFCETDGCTARGEWHHADPDKDDGEATAQRLAYEDGEEHELSHRSGV